ILSNAIHALEQNADNRKIKISFQETDGWHQVTIWNNGPAIPESVKRNLMRPFFTTKTEGHGTGLGLSVSKAIMEVHEGALSFSSDEEKGTQFTLSFPKPAFDPWARSSSHSVGPIVLIDG